MPWLTTRSVRQQSLKPRSHGAAGEVPLELTASVSRNDHDPLASYGMDAELREQSLIVHGRLGLCHPVVTQFVTQGPRHYQSRRSAYQATEDKMATPATTNITVPAPCEMSRRLTVVDISKAAPNRSQNPPSRTG